MGFIETLRNLPGVEEVNANPKKFFGSIKNLILAKL